MARSARRYWQQRLWDLFIKPPYYGVPWLVFVYALLSCLIYHQNGPLTGHLLGFDDHVRMVQVLNWINGAGWYDRVITRANPPEGFETIWPRIVDIPIAFVVVVAQIFVDQKTAALVAGFVVPLIEIIILFIVAYYFARPLVGKDKARLITLFLLFTSVFYQKPFTFAGFHLGEASHHSWYVILDLLLFGAAARVVLGIAGRAPKILMGLAIALLLAVGIEGLPIIAGTLVILGALAWAFDHRALAHRGSLGAGFGALLGLVLLPMHQPPQHLFDISFSQPSILGPIFVGVAALVLWLESEILARFGKKRVLSLLCMLAVAGLAAGALVFCFPQILQGPAAALSPSERQLAHNEHPESWIMWRVATSTIEYIGYIMPTLIALAAGFYALRTTSNRRRRTLYAAYFGFTLLTGGMAQMFWRYYHHAMTSACGWLVWAWERIKRWLPKKRHYGLAVLGSFFALGPFWMVILPAMEGNFPFMSHVILFPGKLGYVQTYCDPLPISQYLDSHYEPQTDIIVPRTDSADILYHTHLTVDFLANFPSHDKFIENMYFFETGEPDEARAIAARHHFDLVALCRYEVPAYSQSSQDEPLFNQRLAYGNPPPWLKLVNANFPGGYVLYAVDKAALSEK